MRAVASAAVLRRVQVRACRVRVAGNVATERKLDCLQRHQWPTAKRDSSSLPAGSSRRWARGSPPPRSGGCCVARGFDVQLQKFDPYINVDPGTMSPYQHGEVFVTEDGAETDLDLGHYERFTDANTSRASNVTAGGIYNTVIRRERRGDYLGATVQVVPHITDEIKQRIRLMADASEVDFVITEIGGTVGDIESLPFLEAIRQFPVDVGRRRCMFIHLTLVPYIGHAGELKTKPTQHSVNELRRIGIAPDMVVCRSESALSTRSGGRSRCSPACPVAGGRLRLGRRATSTRCRWSSMTRASTTTSSASTSGSSAPARPERLARIRRPGRRALRRGPDRARRQVRKARGRLSVGRRGAASQRHPPRLQGRDRVDRLRDGRRRRRRRAAAKCRRDPDPRRLRRPRLEGKIAAARVAREQRIPYLGVCLGMHIAVCEFARHVAGMDGRELDRNGSGDAVSGDRPVARAEGDRRHGRDDAAGRRPRQAPRRHLCPRAYGEPVVYERHRHRYEVNNHLRRRLQAAGLVFSGTTPDERLVEVIELPREGIRSSSPRSSIRSSSPGPSRPAPLFREFVGAALAHAHGSMVADALAERAFPAGSPATSAAAK